MDPFKQFIVVVSHRKGAIWPWISTHAHQVIVGDGLGYKWLTLAACL
jgi:hypothetical protein